MLKDNETFYIPKLPIPNSDNFIGEGDIIILDRFSTIKWVVGFGWYSFDGNRKVNGWYLRQLDNEHIVKPIQEIDLYDIYVIQRSCNNADNPTLIPPEEPSPILLVTFESETGIVRYYSRTEIPELHNMSKFDGYTVSKFALYTDKDFFDDIRDEVKQIIAVDDKVVEEVFSLSELFSELPKLTFVDVSKWDWVEVDDLSGLFKNCPSLVICKLGDLSKLELQNTSKMFYNDASLQILEATFSYKYLTDASSMFENCTQLQYDASYMEIDPTVTNLESFNMNAPNVIPPTLINQTEPDPDNPDPNPEEPDPDPNPELPDPEEPDTPVVTPPEGSDTEDTE